MKWIGHVAAPVMYASVVATETEPAAAAGDYDDVKHDDDDDDDGELYEDAADARTYRQGVSARALYDYQAGQSVCLLLIHV